MSLTDTITSDMKEAMKAKDKARLSTLRMLKTALKNKQIELMHELSDEEALAVVKKQIKELNKSIELFETGGRPELAEAAKAEIEILESYLPK